MADLFMDVHFVATDNINLETLLDEDKFIKTFVVEMDEMGIESAYATSQEDLICLLTFIFNQPVNLTALTSNGDKEVYDLTPYKHNCITEEELEIKYKDWLSLSKRKNSMTQYGILLSVIYYIRNNVDKNYLLALTEKRKQ
jgi:hypothetical protein